MRGAALASLLLLSISPLEAKDFGEHGGYEVASFEGSSETDRGGCVMAEDDFEGPGSTHLRMFRFVADPTLVTVTIENYNWTAKDGEEYELTYQFDKSYYERTATGTQDGIYHGFIAVFPYSNFIDIFAKSTFLHVYRGDVVVDKLSLEGSAAGREAFEKCFAYALAEDRAKTRERERWKAIPKDPFSLPPSEAKP